MDEGEEKVLKRINDLRHGAFLPGDCGYSTDQPPPWLDRERFYRARDIFKKYFFSIFFAHLAGLMLIVYIPSMMTPLLSTGNSSNLVCLFRRYLATLQHVRRWYEGDIWNPADDAHKSVVLVRQMHKRVGDKLNNNNQTRPACSSSSGVYISQLDMSLTQFAFFGLIVLYPKKIGIHCSKEDLECLIHFWRGIGYLLGIDDRYNVCGGSYDETVALSKKLLDDFMRPAIGQSHPQTRTMSRNIVKAINSFIVFLSWEAMTRFWYELMEVPWDFAMGVYERTGYRLMRITFGYLLRLDIFHRFFNFLLKFTIVKVNKNKDYFEKKLKEG